MRSTLKIYSILALLVITFTANAQKYRLEIGYNNPVRKGAAVSSTYFNGIRLGGTAEFDLKNNFSLLTGVLYNFVYSNKIQMYTNKDSVRYKSVGHLIEIPIRATYTLPLSKTLKLFGYAGPNISFGLAQKQETTSQLTPEYNSLYEVNSGTLDIYKSSMVNRLNLQIGVGGGVQWKKYQLKSGYDWGINNLDRTGTGIQHQNGWYVSFAYEF